MDALESGAIANPDEKRMVGHYWLRAPKLAPTKEIAREIAGTIESIKKFGADVHAGKIKPPSAPRFTQVLAIGIGGSALGPMFVGDALGNPAADRMTIHFIDNTDPDGIARVLQKLKGMLRETLVIVTSKSGGTPDTRNGMIVVADEYRAADLDFSRHVVAVTIPGSQMDKLASTEDWLPRFPVFVLAGGGAERSSPRWRAPRRFAGDRHASHARRASRLRRSHARSRYAPQSRRVDGPDVVCRDRRKREEGHGRPPVQRPPAPVQPLLAATRDGVARQAARSRRPPRRAGYCRLRQ